jgi:aminopeptidase N
MTRAMLVVLAAGLVFSAAVRADDDDDMSCAGRHALEAQRRGAADDQKKTRDASFDEGTGADKLNYPPHRFADYKSMLLEVAVRDMQTPVMVARETLTVAPIGRALTELSLDAGPPESMSVGEISLVRTPGGASEKINFTRERSAIVLRFEPALEPDADGVITIPYIVTDPPEGLNWTPASGAWPGRAAQVHTQGQAQSNHFWFPCHDFPNERLLTEIVATVPSGFIVSSNGHLVEKGKGWPAWARAQGFPVPDNRTAEVLPWESAEVPDNGKAKAWDPVAGASYESFHWKLDRPHVNYLVSMVVGKFDVVDVGGRVPAVGDEAPARKLELPVYVPPGKGALVKQTYGRTLDMIKLFEKRTGEAYPWGDRYAQLTVWNFGAGGMENSGATSLFDTAYLDKTALLDGDLDGLISHELGHQWFGDLITCNSWEHIWLNEGWATYMSDLWFEERDGRDAYDAGQWGHLKALGRDKADAPYQPGMVSKVYAQPWEAFGRSANPYPKGAAILGMLRAKLGDEVFFKGVATYVDRFKERTAHTADFRRALEDVSGLTLQRFFDQWAVRPGVPKVKVETSYDDAARAVTVKLSQTQPIDGWNPAFELDVPLVIGLADGKELRPRLVFDTREASLSISGVAAPRWTNVDPSLTQLVDYDVTQGTNAWAAILDGGGPIGGRLRAAEALAKLGTDSSEGSEAGAALLSVLRDKQAYWGLRTAAADAMGKLGRAEDLMGELDRGVPDARIRKAVVSAIAAANKPEARPADYSPYAADRLAALVDKDESYGVRAAAVRSIGQFKAARHMPIALRALETESQNDQIRIAALESLADLDQAEGLDAAIRWTRFGVMARTRPTAVRVVTQLAKHDPDKAYGALVALLSDSEDRTARSAGDALVSLKDPRAVAVLEEFVQRERARGNEAMATSGERWLKALREKPAGG